MRPILPGRASHEFIITLQRQARELDVTTMDFAKRLLDHGFHAPTTYFPLLVPECLLIEPTETESKDILDAFVAAMTQILQEAQQEPGARDERTAYHAGAAARRRSGGEAAGSEMEADSVIIDRYKPAAPPAGARSRRQHPRPAGCFPGRSGLPSGTCVRPGRHTLGPVVGP